jgi:hypothetical protein
MGGRLRVFHGWTILACVVIFQYARCQNKCHLIDKDCPTIISSDIERKLVAILVNNGGNATLQIGRMCDSCHRGAFALRGNAPEEVVVAVPLELGVQLKKLPYSAHTQVSCSVGWLILFRS